MIEKELQNAAISMHLESPCGNKCQKSPCQDTGLVLGINWSQMIDGRGHSSMTNLVSFRTFRHPLGLTDRTFDSAELLLCSSAQMTELFSAEHRTFLILSSWHTVVDRIIVPTPSISHFKIIDIRNLQWAVSIYKRINDKVKLLWFSLNPMLGSQVIFFDKMVSKRDLLMIINLYSKTAYANPLNPDAFPGIRKMEAEVVRMCCNLFNGDPDKSCGTVRKLYTYIDFLFLF